MAGMQDRRLRLRHCWRRTQPLLAADPALIAAARKEGEVVWYTTQIISQLVRPVTAAFEKKYPGIKVRSTRANASETAVKILNESRAGRLQADVFDGTTTVVPLKAEGYVLQWLPDAAKEYPPEVKDPEGYWIANNLFVITPGFNTSLIPRGKEPRTLQDLLNPALRGKMAWNGFPTSSGVGGFIGTVLTEMGQEKGMAYLRELVEAEHRQSARLGARGARSGDRRRVFAGAADLQPPRGDQRQEGRAGRLDSDGAGDRARSPPSRCSRTRRIPTPPSCSWTSSSRAKARRCSGAPTTSRRIRACRRACRG